MVTGIRHTAVLVLGFVLVAAVFASSAEADVGDSLSLNQVFLYDFLPNFHS